MTGGLQCQLLEQILRSYGNHKLPPLGLVTAERVPLTRNMLVTMKSDIILPPNGDFEHPDAYLR